MQKYVRIGISLLAAALTIVRLPAQSAAPASIYSPYIFAWIGDGQRQSSDFLAVIDADPKSSSYGRVVATLPVNARATMPHHTEYELSSTGLLMASGWAAGRTFVLDVRQPTRPKLAGSFTTVGAYSFPHSFRRLPNGNVLAAFQGMKDAYAPPGGLVEMDARGTLLRAASAAAPPLDPSLIWPYSLEVDATRDRVVTTSTPMGLPPWATPPQGSWRADRTDAVVTKHLQVWRLSDLKLLATMPLPESGRGKHHEYPAEPRLLPDGSIYVNTFRCGLYHVTALDDAQPRIRFVHAFAGGEEPHTMCAVPVVLGKYWIQSVAALPGLVALDVSDPARPVEVSRLGFTPSFHMPHWIAADRTGSRVLVTGDDQSYVLLVDVDPMTGNMTVDQRFTGEKTGGIGTGKVHGAVFGPR